MWRHFRDYFPVKVQNWVWGGGDCISSCGTIPKDLLGSPSSSRCYEPDGSSAVILGVPKPCLQYAFLPRSTVRPLCAHSPLSLQLVKTHDLSPGHNYIIGSHPHGILCVGAFCNFITGSTGFSELFPGIRPFLTTLAGNFRLPLFREYLMSGGEWGGGRVPASLLPASGPQLCSEAAGKAWAETTCTRAHLVCILYITFLSIYTLCTSCLHSDCTCVYPMLASSCFACTICTPRLHPARILCAPHLRCLHLVHTLRTPVCTLLACSEHHACTCAQIFALF